MHNQCYFLLAFVHAIAGFFVQVNCASMNISIIYDSDGGLLGSNATVRCDWSLEGPDLEATILIKDTTGKKFYIYDIGLSLSRPQSDKPQRYSLDTVSKGDSAITMMIRSLQCSDERDFLCMLVNTSHNQIPTTTNVHSQLRIKVRPEAPELISMQPPEDQLSKGLEEDTSVSVTCQGNTGRPDVGRIRWGIYRGQELDVLEPNDTRIVSYRSVPLEPHDVNCTERIDTTLEMMVTRQDQNLVINCYIINDDFVPDTPAQPCSSHSRDMCSFTPTIQIFYPVLEAIVTQDPPGGKIAEGGDVTFTCIADGHPPPFYTWIKISDGSTLFIDLSEELGSKLVIGNVTRENHGDRYKCTVTNIFWETVHSVPQGFELNFFGNEDEDASGSKGFGRVSRDCALTGIIVGLAVMVLTSLACCIGHYVCQRQPKPTFDPTGVIEPLKVEQAPGVEEDKSAKAEEDNSTKVEEGKSAVTSKATLRASHESEV